MKTEPSPISSSIKICLMALGFFHVEGRERKYAHRMIPNTPRKMGSKIIWTEIYACKSNISQSSPPKG
jgi:hypothetical protein